MNFEEAKKLIEAGEPVEPIPSKNEYYYDGRIRKELMELAETLLNSSDYQTSIQGLKIIRELQRLDSLIFMHD